MEGETKKEDFSPSSGFYPTLFWDQRVGERRRHRLKERFLSLIWGLPAFHIYPPLGEKQSQRKKKKKGKLLLRYSCYPCFSLPFFFFLFTEEWSAHNDFIWAKLNWVTLCVIFFLLVPVSCARGNAGELARASSSSSSPWFHFFSTKWREEREEALGMNIHAGWPRPTFCLFLNEGIKPSSVVQHRIPPTVFSCAERTMLLHTLFSLNPDSLDESAHLFIKPGNQGGIWELTHVRKKVKSQEHNIKGETNPRRWRKRLLRVCLTAASISVALFTQIVRSPIFAVTDKSWKRFFLLTYRAC